MVTQVAQRGCEIFIFETVPGSEGDSPKQSDLFDHTSRKELDWMISGGLFQPKLFCGPVIVQCYTCWLVWN